MKLLVSFAAFMGLRASVDQELIDSVSPLLSNPLYAESVRGRTVADTRFVDLLEQVGGTSVPQDVLEALTSSTSDWDGSTPSPEEFAVVLSSASADVVAEESVFTTETTTPQAVTETTTAEAVQDTSRRAEGHEPIFESGVDSESDFLPRAGFLSSRDGVDHLLGPRSITYAVYGRGSNSDLGGPIVDQPLSFASERMIPIIALNPESKLIQLGSGLGCLKNKISVSLSVGPAERRSQFFAQIHVPLYLALVDAEFKAGAERDPEALLFLELLRQLHFRAVAANVGGDEARFLTIADYALEVLVGMAARSHALRPAPRMGAAVKIGSVEIPAEVVEVVIQAGWCCLTACIRSCINRYTTTTTTTTTTTLAPTIDPAIAQKRRDELRRYIEFVNVQMDSISQQIGRVRATAGKAEFGATMLALRSMVLEKYSVILSTALLNECLELDISGTKSKFSAISAAVGAADFDPATFETVIGQIEASTMALRNDLLEAATKATRNH